MSSNDSKPTRPRIISRGPDDHPATVADVDEELSFFVLDGEARLKAVKAKIEEREKVLFDLIMVETMLDGNPEPGVCSKRTMPDGLESSCPCGDCELVRVRGMKAGIVFAISKLKAILSRLS